MKTVKIKNLILVHPLDIGGRVLPSVSNSNPKIPEFEIDLIIDDIVEFRVKHLDSGDVGFTPLANVKTYKRS